MEIRGLQHPSRVEIAVDGRRVFLGSVGGEADLKALFENASPSSDLNDARLRVTVPVKAGPREVTAVFLEKPQVGNSLHLQAFLRSPADPADGTASGVAGLRQLPQSHGSSGTRARKL